MGALSDRWGRRKLLIQLGLLVMAASTLLFTVAQTFWQLLILCAAQGIGVALTIPAAMAVMTAATERKTRGGAMGVYTTMRMTGFVGGPLLGGALYDSYGFDTTFYIGAGAIMLGFVLVQLIVHERPVAKSRLTVAPPTELHAQAFSSAVLGLGLATMIMTAAFSMMTPLEAEFNRRLHENAFTFSIAFSALMITRLIFQLPLGRLSDRIGRKPPIVAGLLLLAPATTLLGFVGSSQQLVLVRLVQGLAAAAIAAPLFAATGDLSTVGREARQMSVITSAFGLGIAVGPLLAGLLALWSFALPFVVGGVLSLLAAAVVYFFVPETVPRTNDGEE